MPKISHLQFSKAICGGLSTPTEPASKLYTCLPAMQENIKAANFYSVVSSG